MKWLLHAIPTMEQILLLTGIVDVTTAAYYRIDNKDEYWHYCIIGDDYIHIILLPNTH